MLTRLVHGLLVKPLMVGAMAFVLVLALGLMPDAACAIGTWTPQKSDTTTELRSVAFPDDTHGWAVGYGGTILATTDGGLHWAAQRSGTANPLLSVTFPDDTHGWAVSSYGTILSTTDGGAHWRSVNSGQQLNAISFVDDTHGMAVGDYGTILTTTDGGAHWTARNSGTDKWLFSICLADRSHAWAVGGGGGGGTILKTADGGVQWTVQKTQVWQLPRLDSVRFVSANRGWAVGTFGTVLATADGGEHWTAQTPGDASYDLNSLVFHGPSQGWAGGTFGTILDTIDGGKHWSGQTSGITNNALDSVAFPDATHGWAVGTDGTIIAYNAPAASKPSSNASGWNNIVVRLIVVLVGLVVAGGLVVLALGRKVKPSQAQS
jgi:photosystem II stability/assembly factor-like uncharacterized protein